MLRSVLLDTTQDEGLKIKGFAREFINRVQKLKKKSKFNPEDQVLIFYKLHEKSKMLRLALEKERKLIESAVKKPLVDYADYTQQIVLEKEEGVVEDERYEVIFTRAAAIVHVQELNVKVS